MKRQLILLSTILLLSFGFNGKPLPTSLKVTVIDNLGNFVEGADVTLFKTEDDYRNETNPVAGPIKTDAKGRVKFKDIEAISYYIHAVKGDKTNIGGGTQTAPLNSGRLNKVNTVIQ